MPPKFALRFRAFCVAVALVLATAPAALAAAANPLIGATRDQVLAKLGEPKNTIVAGNREVLFFETDRVTLRDNVVIAVERIAAEPVRRPPPPPTSAPAATDQQAPASATPAGTSQSAANEPAANAAKDSGTASASGAKPSITSTPPPATPPAPDPNAPLEIKVRAPGSRPVSRVEPPAVTPPPTPPARTTTVPVNQPPAEKSSAKSASPVVATTTPPPASVAPAPTRTEPAPEAKKPTAETPAIVAPTETAKAEPTDGDDKKDAIQKKAKAGIRRARRAAADALEDDLTEQQQSFLSPRTYIIGAITVGAGVAFLLWRNRQRQLELAATAVSRTPFNAPTATSGGSGGAVFTMDIVSKLEWKRFEELVASYYSKTGVVAARTKTGPASPVHIKISWKGEPRPFALVQCISHPTGLIDAKPLQELVTVLAAEDIRRGYVVTTGKFNVPARDYAEEKHITLLSGDIFLEKINALPDAARNELMSEVTNGDYSTPSCPKCEAKMVKNPDDSSQWRCAAHPDQIIPVK